jgi:hypothetical protein
MTRNLVPPDPEKIKALKDITDDLFGAKEPSRAPIKQRRNFVEMYPGSWAYVVKDEE